MVTNFTRIAVTNQVKKQLDFCKKEFVKNHKEFEGQTITYNHIIHQLILEYLDEGDDYY